MKFTDMLCVFSLTLLHASVFSVFAQAPETEKIVFTSRRDGNFEIYLMNPDGSDQTNLTQHRAKDSAPVWSPTGEQKYSDSLFLAAWYSFGR